MSNSCGPIAAYSVTSSGVNAKRSSKMDLKFGKRHRGAQVLEDSDLPKNLAPFSAEAKKGDR